MESEEFVQEFLEKLVRDTAGDEVVASIDRMSKLAEELAQRLWYAQPLLQSQVDEYNQIREKLFHKDE